jgi:hypothetical protein
MKNLEIKFEKFIKMEENHTDSTEYELKIKNEYTELEPGDARSILDLGEVGVVPKANIDNIQKTYPDSIVEIKNGHFWLVIKK